jgi:hypothetical protein
MLAAIRKSYDGFNATSRPGMGFDRPLELNPSMPAGFL